MDGRIITTLHFYDKHLHTDNTDLEHTVPPTSKIVTHNDAAEKRFENDIGFTTKIFT